MEKLISFVKLDIRLIKPYLRSLLVLLGLGIFIGIATRSGDIISTYFMTALIMIMSYPFAVAEKNKLDVLYGTLTINKRAVVVGRYLSALLFAVIGSVVSFVFSTIFTVAFGKPFDPIYGLTGVCFSAALYMFVISVQYPLFFKYGYMKARMASFIPLLIIIIVVILIPTISELFGKDISLTRVYEYLTAHSVVSCLSLLAVGILSAVISCVVSCDIYGKKDV